VIASSPYQGPCVLCSWITVSVSFNGLKYMSASKQASTDMSTLTSGITVPRFERLGMIGLRATHVHHGQPSSSIQSCRLANSRYKVVAAAVCRHAKAAAFSICVHDVPERDPPIRSISGATISEYYIRNGTILQLAHHRWTSLRVFGWLGRISQMNVSPRTSG
jgi:hypothetical protein